MQACHARSQQAISAIANGLDQDAGYYAACAMHEARYALWIKARLIGRPIIVAFSTGFHDRTDFTRNTGPYGRSVSWRD